MHDVQVARVAVAYPQHLASHLEILQKVANLIGHESVTVSGKACKIFTSLGKISLDLFSVDCGLYCKVDILLSYCYFVCRLDNFKIYS